MRDISTYPVTADEAMTALSGALSEYTRNIAAYGVGNVDGIALLTLEKFIEANKNTFNNFSKEFVASVEKAK